MELIYERNKRFFIRFNGYPIFTKIHRIFFLVKFSMIFSSI